jgi:hypothetical protein
MPQSAYRWGQGYAYDDILAGVVRKTVELRGRYEGVGVVWAMHFPPSGDAAGIPSFLGVPGFYELRFFPRVIDAALTNKVSVVLAGHIHENRVIDERGVSIYCAGSSCAFGEKAGNWIHSLEFEVSDGVASVVNKTDYRWTETAGAFLQV